MNVLHVCIHSLLQMSIGCIPGSRILRSPVMVKVAVGHGASPLKEPFHQAGSQWREPTQGSANKELPALLDLTVHMGPAAPRICWTQVVLSPRVQPQPTTSLMQRGGRRGMKDPLSLSFCLQSQRQAGRHPVWIPSGWLSPQLRCREEESRKSWGGQQGSPTCKECTESTCESLPKVAASIPSPLACVRGPCPRDAVSTL